MEIKTINVPFSTDEAEGTIRGWANVFATKQGGDWEYVVDRVNDIIMPGALVDTGVRPILIDHKFPYRVGVGTIQEKTTKDHHGIWLDGRLAINSKNKQLRNEALLALEDVKNNRKRYLSIGYRVLESEYGIYQGKKARIIRALDILEVSIVGNPANQYAEIREAKSAEEEHTRAATGFHTGDVATPFQRAVGRAWAKLETTPDFRRRVETIGGFEEVVRRADRAILEAVARQLSAQGDTEHALRMWNEIIPAVRLRAVRE